MAFVQQPQAPWSIFKFKKLQRRGVPWDPSNFKLAPTVFLDIVNCNPRFKLYMNEGGESNAINIALDPEIYAWFTESLLYVTEQKDATKLNHNVKGHFGANGVRQEQPFTQSVMTVGRDTDGFVYMAFTIKGKKPAKFIFTDSRYNEFTNSAGEALDNHTKSTICARGWVKMMDHMVFAYLSTKAPEPPQPATKQQQGNSGFQQAPQQQYKPQQAPAQDAYDSDVSMAEDAWPAYPG